MHVQDPPRLARVNVHGVYEEQECWRVPCKKGELAIISLALCADGWRFATQVWAGGYSGSGIWDESPAFRTRRSALLHAIQEIKPRVALYWSAKARDLLRLNALEYAPAREYPDDWAADPVVAITSP